MNTAELNAAADWDDYTTVHIKVPTAEQVATSFTDYADHPDRYDGVALIDEYVGAVEAHVTNSLSPKASWLAVVRWYGTTLEAAVPIPIEQHTDATGALQEAWATAMEPGPEGGVDTYILVEKHELPFDAARKAAVVARQVAQGFPHSSAAAGVPTGNVTPQPPMSGLPGAREPLATPVTQRRPGVEP